MITELNLRIRQAMMAAKALQLEMPPWKDSMAQQSLAHSSTCITECAVGRVQERSSAQAYKGPCDDARETGIYPKEMQNH